MANALQRARRWDHGRRLWQALTAALVVGAGLCSTVASATPADGAPLHLVVGFNAVTPTLVQDAAAVGVTTDVLYNGPPSPTSSLGTALTDAHVHVVDASLSTDLYFWECHRTHTVAPPPRGQRNDYCRRDAKPAFNDQKLLATIDAQVAADARNPLVSGYWVLDDWPSWDGGSARQILQEIHADIASVTPGEPAICGFGAAVTAAGTDGWDASTGENFSTGGCDMVGFYNYADGTRRRSAGTGLDWSMQTLLPAMEQTLDTLGWNPATTPLLGIGQAWSGRVRTGYQPGLSTSQMTTQTRAFCSGGATSVGWYGWTDSSFTKKTETPADSSTIEAGIEQGVAACEGDWGS